MAPISADGDPEVQRGKTAYPRSHDGLGWWGQDSWELRYQQWGWAGRHGLVPMAWDSQDCCLAVGKDSSRRPRGAGGRAGVRGSRLQRVTQACQSCFMAQGRRWALGTPIRKKHCHDVPNGQVLSIPLSPILQGGSESPTEAGSCGHRSGAAADGWRPHGGKMSIQAQQGSAVPRCCGMLPGH